MKTYIDISNLPLTRALAENYTNIRDEFYKLSEFLNFKPNNVMSEKQKTSNGKILYSGKFKLVFTRVAPESCSIPEYHSAFGDKEGNVTPESIERAKLKFESRQKITPVLESCISPYIQDIGTVGFNVIFPGQL